LPNPFSPDHKGIEEPKPAILAGHTKSFNGDLFSVGARSESAIIGSTGPDRSVEVCPPNPEFGGEVVNWYRIGSIVCRELGFRPDTDYIETLAERFCL
jgi:hypothetical protein